MQRYVLKKVSEKEEEKIIKNIKRNEMKSYQDPCVNKI